MYKKCSLVKMKTFHFTLHAPVYVYTKTCPSGVAPLAFFKEQLGESYLLKLEEAQRENFAFTFPCRCIQLEEKTALTAVGITAKVAAVLAQQDIPCNVVAAYHHDYFFVPEVMAEQAVKLLNAAGLTS